MARHNIEIKKKHNYLIAGCDESKVPYNSPAIMLKVTCVVTFVNELCKIYVSHPYLPTINIYFPGLKGDFPGYTKVFLVFV